MLIRLLALALLLGVALIWWTGKRRRDLGEAPPPAVPPAPPPAEALQTMLACAHCGLRFPAGEALADDAGRPYCCAEHRQLGPAAADTPR